MARVLSGFWNKTAMVCGSGFATRTLTALGRDKNLLAAEGVANWLRPDTSGLDSSRLDTLAASLRLFTRGLQRLKESWDEGCFAAFGPDCGVGIFRQFRGIKADHGSRQADAHLRRCRHHV